LEKRGRGKKITDAKKPKIEAKGRKKKTKRQKKGG